MSTEIHDRSMLAAVAPLREAGFALHWLKPRSKKPIGDGWSSAPIATLADLTRTYVAGNNRGVRLGEPSKVGSGYLHVLDIDVRLASEAEAAWAKVRELLPDIDTATLPTVKSGSGGASRHLYFITDKPMRSKKLAVSGVKFNDKSGRHWTWEVELFGTGKQVAMPPSIHPDTGKPYTWEREFDLSLLDLGIEPFIPSAVIEKAGANEDTDEPYDASKTRAPLDDLPVEKVREWLGRLSDARWTDYEHWYQIGGALHHQFQAGKEGLDLWEEFSKTKDRYEKGATAKKWKSFGRNQRLKPVSMATVIQWAKEDMGQALVDQFDEVEDEGGDVEDNFDDLLGGKPNETDGFDDLLGGAEDDMLSMDEVAKPADPTNWIPLLDLTEDGAVKNTQHNADLILSNDPRLAGLAMINEFTQETVQRINPGTKVAKRKNAAKETRQLSGRTWRVNDTLNGELWSDDRDFAIRSIIDAPKTQGGYGYKISLDHLRAAVVNSANKHPFHPVREYLESTKWDGVPRCETMFIDYVGAPDNSYSRDVSRLLLTAAVTRIFEPGHKFDFAVILEGVQGKRKSTFIQTLGRRWFAELDGDMHDPKQMIELMQGAWVMEIPELSGFQRADVRALKAFISRQKDRARLAYARRAGEFPRQCVFVGSTNDREYLKDDTGGRRFWPIECKVGEIDIEALEQHIDQIWAEAVALYKAMRAAKPKGTLPLYLTNDASRAIAARLQESRRVESSDDALAGRIAAWLDKPVNDGGFDDDGVITNAPRNHTCLVEIWSEAMGGDMRAYSQSQAQAIGRAMKLVPGWHTEGLTHLFPSPYGRQRVYERLYSLGRNTPIVGIDRT